MFSHLPCGDLADFYRKVAQLLGQRHQHVIFLHSHKRKKALTLCVELCSIFGEPFEKHLLP